MTIVVAVVSPDGLVLASDSATTQQLLRPGGTPFTSSIWNSANKIVNLRRSWPVGAMTFGAATFDGRSIATHCKDLRLALTDGGKDGRIQALDPLDWSIEQVANSVKDHFAPLYASEPYGVLGFLVGGFGAHQDSPEVWQVMFAEDATEGDVFQPLPCGESGILHQGMTDAISRLVDGVGGGLTQVLLDLQVPPEDADVATEQIRDRLSVPWAWSGMPLGETIDMARFLVETTINFVRFSPGDAVVGGPIEIAALSKHEGFKWVQRKHYFKDDLNPQREAL